MGYYLAFASVILSGLVCVTMAAQGCETELQNETIVSNLAEGNMKFAIDLYKSLGRVKEDANVFLSPFSVTVAIAMTANGAQGPTATEMTTTLGLNKNNDQQSTNKAFLDVFRTLCQKDEPSNVTLTSANNIFVEQSFKIEDQFKNDVTTYYLSDVTPANFKEDAEGARQMVNSWVEKATNNKIKDLLPPGVASSNTKLILANAIYFKGDWAKKFNQALTRPRPFYAQGVNSIEAPSMVSNSKFPYVYDEELKSKMVELDYKGGRMAMYIVLPDDRNGLPDLMNKFTPEKFQQLRNSLSSFTNVVLVMPKFKLDVASNMNIALMELGVRKAFDAAGADFRGISKDSKNLAISDVVHKAFVDVNEEGTEAAAATGVVINKFSLPQTIEFTCDHPFLFIIFDKLTNLTMFIGHLNDPTKLN